MKFKKWAVALVASILAVAALVIGGFTMANADDEVPLGFSKNLYNNGDGTYTLSLSVTGEQNTATTENVTKANVILVIDTSSSMRDNTSGTSISRDDASPSTYRYYQTNGNRAYYRNGSWYTAQNGGDEYTGTLYMSRLEAEQKALCDEGGVIDTLLSQNVPGNANKSDIIEIALVNFGGAGAKIDLAAAGSESAEYWSTNASTLKSKVNGLTVSSGTNWEEGLLYAKQIADAKKTAESANGATPDPTYVIFLTDGEPTTHLDDHSVNTNFWEEWAEAKDDARSIVKDGGYTLYGLFTWGSSNRSTYLSSLLEYAYTTKTGEDLDEITYQTELESDYAKYFTNADSTEALIAALQQIAESIKTTVGVENVEIEDGITSMTSAAVKTQAVGGGEVTGFKYYRSGGDYTGTYNPANNQYGTEWTTITEDGAQEATVDENGSVTWNIGENYMLEDGVTYTVTFVVWPSQESLDLVADLNNGKVAWDEEKYGDSIYKNGNVYSLKTNTEAPSISYDEVTIVNGVETDRDSVDPVYITNPDPVGLAETKLNALKIWEDSLDPSQREEVGTSVTLELWVNGKDYGKGVTLLESENWQKSNYINVAPGILITKDSPAWDASLKEVKYGDASYYILETGNEYVFKETEQNIHFELTAYTHHPMVMGYVDGKPNVKDVVFSKDASGNITGIEAILDLTDSLSATNSLKGGINITKKVVDETGATIDDPNPFTIKVTMKDADGNALPTKTATVNGQSVSYTMDYRIYYGPNNPKYGTEGVSATRPGGRSDHIYVSGTEFEETIYVGDTIRVVNVEDDTVYTVEETAPTGYEYVSTAYTISYGGTAANLKEDPDHTVQNNSASYAEVTNKYVFGALEVSKTVNVTSGDADQAKAKEFEFTFKLFSDANKTTELTGNKYGYTITKADGTTSTGTITEGDTFKLKDGEKIKFDKLPETAYYEITETAAAGYTTTPATRVAGGTIVKNTTATAAFTNTYSVTPVVVDPPVNKVIEGNEDLYNNGDFTFTITNTVKPTSVTTAPMPANTVITNSADYELADKDGYYEFGEITFTAPGTYTYKVTESGSVAGVTNDSAATTGKTITFTVTDNGEGALTVTPTTDQATFVFTNTYLTGRLDITKTVVDETFDSDVDVTFEFTVTLEDANGDAVTGEFPYTIGEEEGTITIGEDGGTIELADGETAVITDLPDGVTYTVEETENKAYKTESEGTTGTISAAAETAPVAAFTNTRITTGIEGKKVWDDADFFVDGKPVAGYERPEITINLLLDEEIVDTATVKPETSADVTETEFVFTDLPAYDAITGDELEYSVSEVEVAGYEGEVVENEITNTPQSEEILNPTDLILKKVDANTGNIIGTGATFTLSGDALEEPVEFTTGDNGTVKITFEKDGTYTLTETDAPEGYQAVTTSWTIVVEKDLIEVELNTEKSIWQWFFDLIFGEDTELLFDEDSQTLTVENPPTTTGVEGNKVWNDNDDADGIRPDSVTFQLYKTVNGTKTALEGKTATLDEKSEWKCSFVGLPAYEDGYEVIYTFDEVTVPEGYTKSISADGLTITNSHQSEPTKIVTTGTSTTIIDGQPVAPGTELTYTITYVNTTGETAETVTVTDAIPQYTEFVSASEPGTNNNGTVTWNFSNVADGATVEVTLVVKVSEDASGLLKNTGKVRVGDNEYDTNEVVNSVPTKTVYSGSSTTIIDGKVVQPGDELTYAITYVNGAGKEAEVTITDVIPAHTTFVSADNDGTESGGTVTWTKTLAKDESITVAFKVTVNDDVNGETLKNTGKVRVGENEAETNEVTNPTPPDVPSDPTGEGNLTIKKELNGRTIEANQFGFTLTPQGSAPGTTETVYNDADGIVDFSDITFIKTGTFKYTIEEVNDGKPGYTYDSSKITAIATVTLDEVDETKLNVEWSIDGQVEDIYVFENTYEAEGEVELEVTKVLEGATLQAGQFSFELKDADGKVLQTKTNAADGKVAFDAIAYTEADADKTFTYTISEVNDGKGGITYDDTVANVFVSVTDNGDGTLNVTAEYSADTFTNIYEASGSVQLTAAKTLNGRDLEDGQFTFELVDEDGNVIQTVTNDASGAITFEPITYDQSIFGGSSVVEPEPTVRSAVPTIVEKSAPGYEPEATVEPIVTVDVPVVDEPVSADEPVVVDEPVADEVEAEPEAEVVADEVEAEAETNIIDDIITSIANFFRPVTAKAAEGDARTATVKYTIREVNAGAAGYTYDTKEVEVTVTVVDNGDGTLTATPAYSEPAEFINTYEAEGSIALAGTKTVTGAELSEGQFSFTLYEGNTALETVKNAADGSFTFSDLEYDQDDIKNSPFTYYIAEENDGQTGYTYDSHVVTVTVELNDNGDGTISVVATLSDGETAVFVNPYVPLPTTAQIEAVKILEGGAPLTAGKFTFELLDAEGNVISTATNDADGNVIFEAITYEEEGTFEYTVTEVVGDDEQIEYDESELSVTVTVTDNEGQLEAVVESDGEITFTNYFTPAPVSYDPPVYKNIKGDKTDKDATFTFQMKALDDAPMPEGANGDTITVQITGAGMKEFGEIVYEEVGEYVYEITEVQGNEDGYTYDKTVYTLTVIVEQGADGNLAKTVIITDGNGNEVTQAAFTNTYSKPKVPETPKTGDTTPTLAIEAMAGFAVAMLAGGFALRRREEN